MPSMVDIFRFCFVQNCCANFIIFGGYGSFLADCTVLSFYPLHGENKYTFNIFTGQVNSRY